MAHQGAVDQGCSLRERLQGFLPVETGFDVAHAALPRWSLPLAPSRAVPPSRGKGPEGGSGAAAPSSPCPSSPSSPAEMPHWQAVAKCAPTGGQCCQILPCMLPCRAGAQGGHALLPSPLPSPFLPWEDRIRPGRSVAEGAEQGQKCPTTVPVPVLLLTHSAVG